MYEPEVTQVNIVCCDESLMDLRALVEHFEAHHIPDSDPNRTQVSRVPSTQDFLDFVPKKYLLQVDKDVLQKLVDIVQLATTRGETFGTLHPDCFLRRIAEERRILPSSIFLSGVSRIGSNRTHGGEGSDVWKGIYDGKYIALKVLRLSTRVERENTQIEFSKEALLWRKLDHPNILPFLGICRGVFDPHVALVSPWMEKGNLTQYLESHPRADCLKLAIGVAHGLGYLHCLRPQIIHGDLRAANVLVDENDEPRITDFSLSKAIDSQGTSVSVSFRAGSLRWLAPELISVTQYNDGSGRFTTKSDVYAFSCVCLEVFTGKAPFHGLRNGQVIQVVTQGKRPPRPGQATVLKGLDDDVWSIMQLCWKAEPSDRSEMLSIVSQLEGIKFRRNFS